MEEDDDILAVDDGGQWRLSCYFEPRCRTLGNSFTSKKVFTWAKSNNRLLHAYITRAIYRIGTRDYSAHSRLIEIEDNHVYVLLELDGSFDKNQINTATN
uniref:Uncharacterized protein n=1 Tax=Oryza punctata TaxID=4537 RepID=A0A0E0LIT2_ORYPU